MHADLANRLVDASQYDRWEKSNQVTLVQVELRV
jgi:hypothetical protein